MTDPMELVGRLERNSEQNITRYCGDLDGAIVPHALLTEAAACIREMVEWRPIETAPRDGTVVDIWVTGDGSRRVPGCRWGKPSRANWGDLYGCDKDLPDQWITSSGFALDRRNGVATHWLPLPPAPGAEA